MSKRLGEFAKKMSGYTAAAGVAAVAGSAGDVDAAPVVYDISATPIQVTSDYFAYGVNMAVLDPTKGPGSALIGVVADSANTGNGAVVSAPSDGAVGTNHVFWRYSIFDDNSGSDKSGTEFGTLVASGNGVYGFIDAVSAQAGRPGHQYFLSSEIIGDDDNLLTGDTNAVAGPPNAYDFPSPATMVGLDGHGAGGSGWGWDITQGVKYLGFQLGGKNGYVHVNEEGARNSFQILGWGMETVPGVPIHAGGIPQTVVPEPSTIALLAIGATGLLAYRSRRRKQK